MLTVKTYVTINQIWFNDPIPSSKYTVYYEEFNKNNLNIFNKFNSEERIYGFVDIQYNSQCIIDNQYFGTITDMWLVYFQLVEAFLKHGEGKESFPDYDCKLGLKVNSNNGITLLVGNQSSDYSINPQIFCLEVLKAAKHFFETYNLVTGDSVYNYFIMERINPLLDTLE